MRYSQAQPAAGDCYGIWYEEPTAYLLCVPATGTTPRIYAAYREQPYWRCLRDPGTISAGQHDFRVHDKNQDGVWNFLVDGKNVWSVDASTFTTGLLWVSGERFSLADSARSDFGKVRRMGSGGTWTAPTGAYEGGPEPSNDDDHKPCIYNDGAHVTVVTNGTSC